MINVKKLRLFFDQRAFILRACSDIYYFPIVTELKTGRFTRLSVFLLCVEVVCFFQVRVLASPLSFSPFSPLFAVVTLG